MICADVLPGIAQKPDGLQSQFGMVVEGLDEFLPQVPFAEDEGIPQVKALFSKGFQ